MLVLVSFTFTFTGAFPSPLFPPLFVRHPFVSFSFSSFELCLEVFLLVCLWEEEEEEGQKKQLPFQEDGVEEVPPRKGISQMGICGPGSSLLLLLPSAEAVGSDTASGSCEEDGTGPGNG